MTNILLPDSDVGAWLELDWLTSHCDMDTQSCVSVGQTACTMTLSLDGKPFPFMRPFAVAMYAWDEATRDMRFMRITSVLIRSAPQECVNVCYPDGATTSYIDSAMWCPPKNRFRARAVRWSVYSNPTFDRTMQVTFWNPCPAETMTRVKIDVYGEGREHL
jgi:hypothetical protein